MFVRCKGTEKRGKKEVIITWSKCFVGVVRNYKYAIKINESVTSNL